VVIPWHPVLRVFEHVAMIFLEGNQCLSVFIRVEPLLLFFPAANWHGESRQFSHACEKINLSPFT
jgi:hypothetical protein